MTTLEASFIFSLSFANKVVSWNRVSIFDFYNSYYQPLLISKIRNDLTANDNDFLRIKVTTLLKSIVNFTLEDQKIMLISEVVKSDPKMIPLGWQDWIILYYRGAGVARLFCLQANFQQNNYTAGRKNFVWLLFLMLSKTYLYLW